MTTLAWTSHEANHQAESFKSGIMREVLTFLRGQVDHGATDQEIQIALRIEGNTERPARVDLVKGGSVVDSGGWRLTRSGRKAIVWRAVG
jgi:hypothetical protein